MEPCLTPRLTSGDSSDPVLIKVGAASNPASIAGVISNAVYEGKKVKLRAIGASAVNQTIKACAIASGFVAQRGLHMYLIVGFQNLQDEGSDRPISAMGFTVICSET